MRRFSFLTALVLALLIAPAAEAAFPGANGRIAFVRDGNAAAEIYTVQPSGTGEARLTSNAVRDDMPTYSPDGSKIAFVSERDGNPEVYVVDAAGTTEPVRLTTNTTIEMDPAWSHDGARIAFTRRGVPGTPGDSDVWVVDADGATAPVRLTTSTADDTDPAWSPDGSTILFESSRSLPGIDIYAMSPTGTDQRPLIATTTADSLDPSWAPDGMQVAFARSNQIHVATAGGTETGPVTSGGGLKRGPAFSPDGDRIAYASSQTGDFDIFTVPAGGGAPQPVTTATPAGDTAPDWQSLPKGPDPDPEETATPGPTATASPTATPTPPPVVGALWEGGGPPAPTCTKSSVRFDDVEAVAACFAPKGRAGVATGRVRVNGLDLVPSGGEIVVDPEQRTITSTRPVRVAAGTIPLFTGRLDWDLSRGRMEIPLDGSLLKLIRIQGTATVTTDGLGRFRIAVLPRIDTIFETFAARLGAASRASLRLPAITGDALLRTENARGLSLESLSLKATSIPIGMLEVRALTLGFDPAAGSWTGTAKLKLPGPPPQVIADATVAVRDGRFERASLVAGNSLGTYGFGVRLERLALDVRTDPFRFGGELALGAGPSLPGLGQLVRVSGTADFTAGTPSELRLRGRTQVGPATGTASYTTSSTGRQDFAGDLALQVQPDLGVSAGVKGVVQPAWFVVQGQARVRVIGLDLQGDGLFSNVGVAACVPVKPPSSVKGAQPFRVGFGYRFATKRVDLMSGSCDVAPWSPVALGDKAAPSARAAQAGTVAAFDVKTGLPGMVIEVSGADAPPGVRLAGPAGTGDPLVLRDAATRKTYLAVAAPRAGRWRLSLEPGSSAVTAVRRGDSLPAPSVRTRVSGRGHRRTLHWTLRALPGQVVRIAEEGRGASAPLVTTGKARGSKRFRPADGPGGRRSIVAVVEQAGLVRERIVAGRYTAPAPQRPARPKRLALRRRGGALTVRWKRSAGASTHRVQAQLSDGRRLLLEVKGRSLRIPAFGPRETATVSVRGVRGPYSGVAAAKRIKRAG